MYELLCGGIKTIDGEAPDWNEIRKMPLVSAEVVVRDCFLPYKVNTNIDYIANCVVSGCREKPIKGSIDFMDIPIIFSDDEEPYLHEFADEDDHVVITGNGKEVLRIISETFRDPTIGDFIDCEKDGTLHDKLRFLKKIILKCLVDIDGFAPAEEKLDFAEIKKRYAYELIKFPNSMDINRIQRKLRTYGLQPKVEFVGQCGTKDFTRIEIDDFFASALRQISEGLN